MDEELDTTTPPPQKPQSLFEKVFTIIGTIIGYTIVVVVVLMIIGYGGPFVIDLLRMFLS